MLFKSLLSLALPLATFGAYISDYAHGSRDQQLARRVPGEVDLHGRFFFDGQWTFYDVGLGACGKVNRATDFVVALNAAQFGSGYPGPNCFKTITMSYGGKTTQAKIVDKCPGCPYGGLDLSRSLFKFFAPESVGVIRGGSWNFKGSGKVVFTPSSLSDIPFDDDRMDGVSHPSYPQIFFQTEDDVEV